MLEKEIKILEVNTLEAVSRLLHLGAVKTFEGHIRDIYFDFRHKVKDKKIESERIFRLRQKGDKNIYTVKNKRYSDSEAEGVMVKEEIETSVDDFQKFSRALEIQGMTPIRKKSKHRVSYKLGDLVFDFDTYDGIPTILEIEGPSGEKIHRSIKELLLHEKELLIGGSRILFHRYNVPYNYC